MRTRVLLVDDDPAFRRLCGMALEKHGAEFVAVGSSSEALRAIGDVGATPFDVILLDVEMPGMKGWELVKLLRDRGLDIPVLLVSIREGLEDKVKGLDYGADDYIVKPCEFGELVSRLHAVLRRIRRRATIRVGDLELDPLLRRVNRNGSEVNLAPREIELLQVLLEDPGAVVSKSEFMSRVWKRDAEPTANALQVHISRLKRKLHKVSRVRIETVARHGYRLVVEGSSPRARDAGPGATEAREAPPARTVEVLPRARGRRVES